MLFNVASAHVPRLKSDSGGKQTSCYSRKLSTWVEGDTAWSNAHDSRAPPIQYTPLLSTSSTIENQAFPNSIPQALQLSWGLAADGPKPILLATTQSILHLKLLRSGQEKQCCYLSRLPTPSASLTTKKRLYLGSIACNLTYMNSEATALTQCSGGCCWYSARSPEGFAISNVGLNFYLTAPQQTRSPIPQMTTYLVTFS